MKPPPHTLARLAGLVALWAAVELLERVAYRAGVTDGLTADVWPDLEAADASDTLTEHDLEQLRA